MILPGPPGETTDPPVQQHYPLLNRLSLGFKANLAITLVLVVLLIAMILLINRRVNQLILHVGQQRISIATLATTVRFQEISHSLMQDTRLIASVPTLGTAVAADDTLNVVSFLRSVNVTNHFHSMHVMDRSGQVVSNHTKDRAMVGFFDAEQELFSAALQGNERLTVLEQTESRALYLVAVTPIREPRTRMVVGALLNSVSLDDSLLKDINLAFPHVGLYLIHNGEIITSVLSETSIDTILAPDNHGTDTPEHAHVEHLPPDAIHSHHSVHMEPIAEQVLLDAAVLAQVAAGQHWTASTITVLHDEPHIAGQAPLIIDGVTVASIGLFVGLADITGFQQQTVQNLTQLFIIMGLAAMVLIYAAIQSNVVNPLRRLWTAANQIDEGHYDQRVTVESVDEVGQLGLAFNSMIQRLSTLYATLEQRITERTRQLEYALDAAREARIAAEEANALKTRFIANMSHELRTPLNAIINFAYILKSGVRGPVTEAQIDYLDRVYASGEHLLGLINDILDLAKIEAGRMELYREPVALDELVQSTLSTAIGLTKDKPIQLHHNLAHALPPVNADKMRIRQVLLNLLSNAAKFTDQGQITVRVWQEGTELITGVTDTGIGIPPDKLTTIFEEFRQANEGNDRSYQGTGLGLSICKRLINMHGGRIWVESTVGIGSTFFFSLPLPTLPDAEPVVSQPFPGTEQGQVVLVVDDDPAAIDIVRSYLAQDGYAVYGVTASRMALDTARQLQPATILLDLIMPDTSGWHILADLKADPELGSIPVILYTVLDEQQRGLALGANGYLIKPVNPQLLRDTVAQLVPPEATILAIDDDLYMLDILRYHLQELRSYQVLTATNGPAGLAAIAVQRPDLVLLDLMMPEMDGFAVLEALHAQVETRSIPVIVLTAKDLTADEQAYLQSRVKGLVHKNNHAPEQWLGRVRAVLQQERQGRIQRD